MWMQAMELKDAYCIAQAFLDSAIGARFDGLVFSLWLAMDAEMYLDGVIHTRRAR